MTTLEKAAQQALEAMEEWNPSLWTTADEAAITALRAALAQQDEMQEMLRTLGFDHQCPESIGITLRRWKDGYAAALAQQEQEQEPVARVLQTVGQYHTGRFVAEVETVRRLHDGESLFTHPPRREWVSLTEEEIEDMSVNGTDSELRRKQFARAIEQACKERNNG